MKTALRKIAEYPVNGNSDPDVMAYALEEIQDIAQTALEAGGRHYSRAESICQAGLIRSLEQQLKIEREKNQLVRDPGRIAQAIARGWCDKINEHKEMDVNLAISIKNEIIKLLEI